MGAMGIRIKGKSGGVLEIMMQPSSTYDEIKLAIGDKLNKHKGFFSGSEAKVIFRGKALSALQRKELRQLLHEQYGIANVAFGDEAPVQQIETVKQAMSAAGDEQNRVTLVSKEYFDAKSVFVSHTLRSGQRIECEGDIVVLGDVNDGAEVIAGGSIAVMGTLRGLAHAGAMGRADVVVAANVLAPKQLRISGKIAVFPSDAGGEGPKVAEYKQGSIVIRPLKPGRSSAQ
jgi:septum site-determining protein MinC